MYNGILTSKLAVSQKAETIGSFEELLASNLNLALEMNTVSEEWLTKARPGSVFYNIYHKKMKLDSRYVHY